MQEHNNNQLPPELDWENMKGGIFEKIETLQVGASAPEKNNRSRKVLVAILLLLIGFAGGSYFALQFQVKSSQKSSIESTELESLSINKTNLNSEAKSASSNPVDAESSLKSNENTKKKSLLTKSLESNNITPENTDGVFKEESKIIGRNSFPYGANSPKQAIEHYYKSKNHISFQKEGSTENGLSFGIDFDVLTLDEMPLQQIQANQPNELRIRNAHNMFLNENIEDKSNLSGTYFYNQLILESGFLAWKEGYGSTKPQRAQYETTLPSFQLQASFSKYIKGSYFLMTGIQYQSLQSKFEYSSPINDYSIVLNDTIVQIQIDLYSGEERVIRGDVEQAVEAQRRVIHYNSTQQLKLSFGLGKSWRLKNLQTDLYFGAAVNSLTNSDGRTFYNDAVVDYSGSQNAFLSNRWSFDGFFGARAKYPLTEYLGLTSSFQLQRSFANWSLEPDVSLHPMVSSLQFGLSYSLR